MSKHFRILGDRSAAIPTLAGRNALKEASADDLRVLLCLIELGDGANEERLADAVGCSSRRVCSSLEYWEDAGIIAACNEEKKQKSRKKALRAAAELAPMTGEETASVVQKRDLKKLIDEAQLLYGKVFSTSEIGVIAGLAEQLELEDGYILVLLAWCVGQGKKSLRYAEKTAFSLYEEGIETLAALEEHISRREAAASGIGRLRRMFGIGERALTKREDEIFTRWLTEYAYDVELLGIAYDITVNTSGKASVAYADKIVTKWHSAGCRTESDVEALIEREKKNAASYAPKQKQKSEPMGSFDTDEFFNRALERSYGKKGG